MRTIFTTHFISLDGVAEAPGGEPGYRHSGWTLDVAEDPAAYEPKGREQEEATAFLMGARSYAAFAPVWPTMTDVFPRYNAMPKYVVSDSIQDPEWANTSVIGFDEVAALKEGDGGPIIVQGSLALTQSLLEARLVDEMRFSVFPVILGSGRRVFPDDAEDKVRLDLVDQQTFGNGIQYLTYRVQR